MDKDTTKQTLLQSCMHVHCLPFNAFPNLTKIHSSSMNVYNAIELAS